MIRFLFLVLALVAFPSSAFAGNAFSDVIYDDRYESDIKSISWLTGIMDSFTVTIVSAVGFMIISLALMKNVFTGAYVAYPKFFDKLEEHRHNARGNGNPIVSFLGFFIPNIKPLTDFDDGVKNPRDYMIKSLAIGMLTVFMGVFIFNAQYRDVIAKGAELGTHIVDKYVLTIDLIGNTDRIMNSGQDYKFTFGKETTGGRARTAIAEDIYNGVRSKYGTLLKTADAKHKLGQSIESYLIDYFSVAGLSGYFDDKNWKMAYDVRFTGVAEEPRMPELVNNENKQMFYFAEPLYSFGMDGVDPEIDNTYVQVLIQFTRTDAKVSPDSTIELSVSVSGAVKKVNSDNSWKIELPQKGDNYLKTSKPVKFENSAGAIIEVSSDGATMTMKPAGGSVSSVSGTWKYVPGNSGYLNYGANRVINLTINSNAGASKVGISGEGIGNVTYGDPVVAVKKE